MSAYRTVAWQPPSPGFFVQPPLVWPTKDPSDTLPFTFNITAFVADLADTIVSFDAWVTQSRTNDIAVVDQSFVAGLLTVLLTSGRPGQFYAVNFSVNFASGAVAAFAISILCDHIVALDVGKCTMYLTTDSPLTGWASGFATNVTLSTSFTLNATALTLAPASATVLGGVLIGPGFKMVGGVLTLDPTALPTSASGLAHGTPWNNANTLSFAP